MKSTGDQILRDRSFYSAVFGMYEESREHDSRQPGVITIIILTIIISLPEVHIIYQETKYQIRLFWVSRENEELSYSTPVNVV